MSQTPLTVTIEKLVQGGRGLAHHEGQVVFVPGVIPSETVSVAMGERRRGVQEAAVQAVLTPSPERIQAPCPVYGQCGGCQFQHIRYESQLALKAQILRET
ncbi:MAG: TRAM domain-containing protein, partial [Nitrospirales bacterium]